MPPPPPTSQLYHLVRVFLLSCKAELSREQADKIEALVQAARKRLEELIAGRRSLDDGEGGERGSVELLRLWEDGKEQLLGLIAKDGQVLHNFFCFFPIVRCTVQLTCWRGG